MTKLTEAELKLVNSLMFSPNSFMTPYIWKIATKGDKEYAKRLLVGWLQQSCVRSKGCAECVQSPSEETSGSPGRDETEVDI